MECKIVRRNLKTIGRGFNMGINISVAERLEIERLILIINIGLLTALKEKLISVDEAENYLYNPYTIERLKKLKVKDEIAELIHLGCELEDVETLIPDKMKGTIEFLKEKSLRFMEYMQKSSLPIKKWVD